MFGLEQKQTCTLSPQKSFSVQDVLLKNGEHTKPEKMRTQGIILVCSGECDALINGMPFRLTKGGWVNVPGGAETVVRVYRSTEKVRALLLCGSKRTRGERRVVSGNVRDLLRMPAEVPFAVFGQESMSITGTVFRLSGSTVLNMTAPCELGLAALDGGARLCRGDTEREIRPGIVWVEKGAAFRISSAENCDVILFKTPPDMAESAAYMTWLKENYGILWDRGAITV